MEKRLKFLQQQRKGSLTEIVRGPAMNYFREGGQNLL